MSVYASGSCNLRAGSSKIIGNNTDFLTRVSVGNLFKVTSENVFYTVAAINTATRMQLSSRYQNTSYETAKTENVATANSATKIYSGTVSNTPVIQDRFVLNASVEKFTDDGGGTLSGDQGGSGTIGYDDGSWSITLGTNLTATVTVEASYYYGESLNGVSYQVIKDYTPNYSWPEQNAGDLNPEAIFTKALRSIDSDLYDSTKKITTVATSYTATSTDFTVVASLISSNIRIVLPTTGLNNRGKTLRIINNSASYNVTATCNASSDSIEGNVSSTLTSTYSSMQLQCVATGLWVFL